jgi:hypothetical protein
MRRSSAEKTGIAINRPGLTGWPIHKGKIKVKGQECPTNTSIDHFTAL